METSNFNNNRVYSELSNYIGAYDIEELHDGLMDAVFHLTQNLDDGSVERFQKNVNAIDGALGLIKILRKAM